MTGPTTTQLRIVCTDRGQHQSRLLARVDPGAESGDEFATRVTLMDREVSDDRAAATLIEKRDGGVLLELRCRTCKRSPRLTGEQVRLLASGLTATAQGVSRIDASYLD